MDWFFNWFRKRMIRAGIRDEGVALRSGKETVTSQHSVTAKSGNKRVELLSAINGKVLEIAHRKHANADWDVYLYIVRDDEALADAVATALLVTGEN
jgi:hypothetical protein